MMVIIWAGLVLMALALIAILISEIYGAVAAAIKKLRS